ncbi:hypothetical protein WJX81_006126 [Elliptochloris bilobata]|uniref:snRNA-activating protein complex subunit 3 n=1 Tax=Elliptochloris bilobata TaxID=381761 RepID=A0AAW1SGL0_9CHLO
MTQRCVLRFKEEAGRALEELHAQLDELGSDEEGLDLDASSLRLPTLEEELEQHQSGAPGCLLLGPPEAPAAALTGPAAEPGEGAAGGSEDAMVQRLKAVREAAQLDAAKVLRSVQAAVEAAQQEAARLTVKKLRSKRDRPGTYSNYVPGMRMRQASFAAGEEAATLPQGCGGGGSQDEGVVAEDEVLLLVGVQRFEAEAGRRAQRMQEFWVLGSQPLAALRDVIGCAADANMGALGLTAPGAYLHVEGAFHRDLRAPGAADLSEPVRAFCEAKGLQPPPLGAPGAEAALHCGVQRLWGDADLPAGPAALAPFTGGDDLNPRAFSVSDMAATTWEQLALRVGSAPGYVYCHQGCCEHALYVADARRVHAGDPRARSAYPLQTFQAKSLRRHCGCCGLNYAARVTWEDALAPSSPAFCIIGKHYCR